MKIGEAGFTIGFSIMFLGCAFANIPMVFAGISGMFAAGYFSERMEERKWQK